MLSKCEIPSTICLLDDRPGSRTCHHHYLVRGSARAATSMMSYWSHKTRIYSVLTTETSISIKTCNAVLVYSPPYCIPHEMPKVGKSEKNQQLQADLIEISWSVWASPIISAPKKDMSQQLYFDYHKLNAFSHLNLFPCPTSMIRLMDLPGQVYIYIDARYLHRLVADASRSIVQRENCHHLATWQISIQGLASLSRCSMAPMVFQYTMSVLFADLSCFVAASRMMWHCFTAH